MSGLPSVVDAAGQPFTSPSWYNWPCYSAIEQRAESSSRYNREKPSVARIQGLNRFALRCRSYNRGKDTYDFHLPAMRVAAVALDGEMP